MKKSIMLTAAALLTSTVSGCFGGSKELYILQNKPEIDTQLKAFAELYAEEYDVEMSVVSCGGSSCSLGTQLQSDIAAGETPDIFVIDGLTAYNQYKDLILELTDEEWVEDTDVAFTVDGKVYGFPVAIEGWGMAYNADILEEAEIDPATLNSYAGYQAAFEKLDGMKETLGIDAVVAMAGGAAGMSWVTADHNVNSLLSAGLPYGDLSVTEDLLEGTVDDSRLGQYVNWVELLFEYADPTILTTGNYDAQVGAFANEKVVFIHQGNWIEPNLAAAGATFERAYAPHGTLTAATDGIFVAAPSWYVINKDSDNIEAAKDFLNYLASSEEGHDYMVNQIGAIPAFKSVTLEPTAPLSISVMDWAKEGKIYSWNQYYLEGDFRTNTLGPIYASYAAGVTAETPDAKTTFQAALKAAFESLGD